MKKKILRLFLIILLFILILSYFWIIRTPLRPGQLTLDLNNATFSTISGATLEYVNADVVLQLPDIKPFERVIIIPPDDICGKAMKTPVIIKYNENCAMILGEFHSLYGDKYNTDVVQVADAKFYCDKIKVPFIGLFHIKPYFRIIDMNKEK